MTPVNPFPTPSVLPLENGDRLTHQEFERRYAAFCELTKPVAIGDGSVNLDTPTMPLSYPLLCGTSKRAPVLNMAPLMQ